MAVEPRDEDQPEPEPEPRPVMVAPSTRVTVAFPFSTIKIHEPDARVLELAAIVADLADRLATIQPGPAAEDLQARAQACATALAG